MKTRLVLLISVLLGGCSSAGSSPDGACHASDPSCNPTPATDAGDAGDACAFSVDEAGVTLGCGMGGMGPGDRDDGGDAGAPPPSDASPDARDLPFGASCIDNANCASGLCFDYRVRGTFCTLMCKTNTDCPAPSPGCNGMGVCRMPDMGDGGGAPLDGSAD